MPSARVRAGGDDLRAEASGPRHHLTAAGGASNKSRKPGSSAALTNGNGKDAPVSSNGNTALNNTGTGASLISTGINWNSESSSLLQAYRIAHKIDVPPTFHSALNAAVLSAPGIGKLSPTMSRKIEKRRMPKEHLALAVRKHFNGLAVNEIDTMRDLIYALRTQDRGFKVRFTPRTQR